MSGDRRWRLYQGVDGIWRDQEPLLKGGPSVEVMPVSEHEAALAAGREVDRKTVVRMIWDALESADDWGSINDVQDLADTLLAAMNVPAPEESP